jgi:hypothetical protein
MKKLMLILTIISVWVGYLLAGTCVCQSSGEIYTCPTGSCHPCINLGFCTSIPDARIIGYCDCLSCMPKIPSDSEVIELFINPKEASKKILALCVVCCFPSTPVNKKENLKGSCRSDYKIEANKVIFENEKSYRVYRPDGKLVKQGYGKVIELKPGIYFLNYEKKTDRISIK